MKITKYAAAAYASDCPLPPNNSTVVAYLSNTDTDTQATVFRNDLDQELILAFRGTSDLQDFSTDLNQGLVPYDAVGVDCSSCMVIPTNTPSHHSHFPQSHLLTIFPQGKQRHPPRLELPNRPNALNPLLPILPLSFLQSSHNRPFPRRRPRLHRLALTPKQRLSESNNLHFRPIPHRRPELRGLYRQHLALPENVPRNAHRRRRASDYRAGSGVQAPCDGVLGARAFWGGGDVSV